nr:hypothetical protein [Enterobacter cloacae]
MKRTLLGLTLALSALPVSALADCLSGSDFAKNSTVTLYEQVSLVKKQISDWRINGRNPYTRHNIYNDAGVNLTSKCAIVDNALDLDLSLYGLTWYSPRKVGAFEEDDSRSQLLIERLRLVYAVSDSVQLEVGKLQAKQGLFPALTFRSDSALLRRVQTDAALRSRASHCVSVLVLGRDAVNGQPG